MFSLTPNHHRKIEVNGTKLAMRLAVGVVIGLGYATAAVAGPPFLTDDPTPVETGNWEATLFSTGTAAHGVTSGLGPALEVNYGVMENVQLHVIAPVGFQSPSGKKTKFGYADTELGIKYRFVDPGEDDWFPQIAVFPLVEVPTGNQRLDLGSGHAQVFLPLWLQKDFGDWTVFGGGGYWVNPGLGNRDWWFTGLGVTRKVTERLSVGAEVFNQTASETGGKDSTGFNVGAVYDISETWHLLGSIGRGMHDDESANKMAYYLGVQMTF